MIDQSSLVTDCRCTRGCNDDLVTGPDHVGGALGEGPKKGEGSHFIGEGPAGSVPRGGTILAFQNMSRFVANVSVVELF